LGRTLVELIVRRLKDQGYLNDAKYARPILPCAGTTRSSAACRVVTDLKAKGVHGEVIDLAVSTTYDEVNEESKRAPTCIANASRSRRSRKQAARIFPAADASGLPLEDNFSLILKKWDVGEQTLTALEESTE